MEKKVSKITTRDTWILMSLLEYRYLSASQIKRLHFYDHKEIRSTNRRLKVLEDNGFIKRFFIPTISESISCLSKAGFDIVSNPYSELTCVEKLPKEGYFMNHLLSINDFSIELKRSCQSSIYDLYTFLPDYYAKKTSNGAIKETTIEVNGKTHAPDSLIIIRNSDRVKKLLFFLEIDRGTESISNPEKGVLKAINIYLEYLLSDGFKKHGEMFDEDFEAFRVLFVTTSRQRIDNIRKVADTIKNEEVKRFIWFTEIDKIKTTNIVFDNIWLQLDSQNNNLYSIGRKNA